MLASIDPLMREKAMEKGLEFTISYDKDVPKCISTDAACLRQCLINLIGNAIKFTKTGFVHVNITTSHKDGQSYIRFDIKDTGIGINDEQKRHIFDKFMCVSDSFTDSTDGIGLGLAITRQLVSLLGAELILESTLGEGSIFSLTIPVGVDVESNPPEKDVASLSQPPQYSGHVLIVEDSRGNQQLIELQMKMLGLETTIAEDGQQAVEAVANTEFDLVLMDIRMPVMNGYDATRIMRENGVTVPIIALTAFAMKGDEDKCIEAGCDNYLAKPVKQKELHQMVGEYLASRSENL